MKTFRRRRHKRFHPDKTFRTNLLCLREVRERFDELRIDDLRRNVWRRFWKFLSNRTEEKSFVDFRRRKTKFRFTRWNDRASKLRRETGPIAEEDRDAAASRRTKTWSAAFSCNKQVDFRFLLHKLDKFLCLRNENWIEKKENRSHKVIRRFETNFFLSSKKL